MVTAVEKEQHLQQTANFSASVQKLVLSVILVVKRSVILVLPVVMVVFHRSVPSAARCVKLTAVNCDAICSGCGVASLLVLAFK